MDHREEGKRWRKKEEEEEEEETKIDSN
jgi:hypothetical protein